jgi:hypothetical protein
MGTVSKLTQLWLASWFEALVWTPAGETQAFSNPYEVRDRWLAVFGRMTSEYMRSAEFLESMARGLILMTQTARMASLLPFPSSGVARRYAASASFQGDRNHGYRASRIP